MPLHHDRSGVATWTIQVHCDNRVLRMSHPALRLVARVLFANADPAVARAVDDAVGKPPLDFRGRQWGNWYRRASSAIQAVKTSVWLLIGSAILVVGKVERAVQNSPCAAPIFVHTRSCAVGLGQDAGPADRPSNNRVAILSKPLF